MFGRNKASCGLTAWRENKCVPETFESKGDLREVVQIASLGEKAMPCCPMGLVHRACEGVVKKRWALPASREKKSFACFFIYQSQKEFKLDIFT